MTSLQIASCSGVVRRGLCKPFWLCYQRVATHQGGSVASSFACFFWWGSFLPGRCSQSPQPLILGSRGAKLVPSAKLSSGEDYRMGRSLCWQSDCSLLFQPNRQQRANSFGQKWNDLDRKRRRSSCRTVLYRTGVRNLLDREFPARWIGRGALWVDLGVPQIWRPVTSSCKVLLSPKFTALVQEIYET